MDFLHLLSPRRLALVLAALTTPALAAVSMAAPAAGVCPAQPGTHVSLPSPPSASKPVNALAGIVTNGTTGHPVAGATVELVRPGLGNRIKEKVVQTTRTSATGGFRFSLAPGHQEHLLLARVVWQNYAYESIAYVNSQHASALNFTRDPLHLEVPVYDVSSTDPGLRYQAYHVAIESNQGGLDCTESILVQNPSRKTFVGETHDHRTLRLKLPAGAQDVKLGPKTKDASLMKEGADYRVAKVIPPSADQNLCFIELKYHMPWAGMPWARSIDLSHPVVYPTGFFFVARPEKESALKVTGAGLSADEVTPLPMGDQTETRIVNTAGQAHGSQVLQPGTIMPVFVSRKANPLFWGFLAFLVVLCGALPLVLRQTGSSTNSSVLPAKRTEPAASVAALSRVTSGDDKASLLAQQIAQLDDRLQAGTLSADEHQQQRSALKQELVQLLQQSSE